MLSYKGKVRRWPPCSNASWLLSSPFASPPNLSLHTLRAPFIHSFIHATPPHLTPPHPPRHRIIASPGLVLPCVALLACLPCPFLISTLLPLAALQTTTTTLILMSTSSNSSSSIFFYSYLALNPFSFEA